MSSNQLNKTFFQVMNTKPITFNPAYAELCGHDRVSNLTGKIYRERDQGAGILLSQLAYWYSAMKSKEFYKYDEELIEECGANRYSYGRDKARLIELGFVTYTRKSLPCKGYWIVHENAIMAAISAYWPVSLNSGQPVSLNSGQHISSLSQSTSESTSESGVNPRPPIFSKESIIIQFKAKPEFLECRNQYPQLDDSIIDGLLMEIAQDVIERGGRTIT